MSHEGIAPTAQEPQDRKAMLLEQFNEAEAAPPVADTQTPVTAQPDPATPGRARDETGKFLPKEKTDQPQLKVAQTAPAQDAAPPVQLEPWQSPPKSWTKEQRENWGKLDPGYQRYVHEREQQMKASYDTVAPKAELADKITKAAEPYMNTIQGLGLDLPRAVAGLMQVDNDLRTLPYEQKLAKLVQVARSYGIDLTGQAQQAQQAGDPGVQNIQNELLQMRGQFQTFAQQQQAAQDRAAQDEIERFAKTAEHFEEVRPTMAQLLQSGMAVGIPDAYDKALRLHPDLFDQIQSAKQAAAEADKRKAADTAAKAAKAAAVSVRSATPGAATPTKAQDRRSMLAEQFSGLSERL